VLITTINSKKHQAAAIKTTGLKQISSEKDAKQKIKEGNEAQICPCLQITTRAQSPCSAFTHLHRSSAHAVYSSTIDEPKLSQICRSEKKRIEDAN
jgi:anthranilate/para-aminobenzoate synthase component I